LELLSEIEQLIKDSEELRSEKGMGMYVCVREDSLFHDEYMLFPEISSVCRLENCSHQQSGTCIGMSVYAVCIRIPTLGRLGSASLCFTY
jgi:hypothetical protein